MKSYKFLILLFFAMNSLATFAQFSVDIFSGYNHSKNTYEFPDNYDYLYNESYYTGNILDTIYNTVTDTTTIRYEIISHIFDYGATSQSFTPKKVLGINASYTYYKYFKTGLSFEKHGISNAESSFKVDKYIHVYSNENMLNDSIISSYDELVVVKYQTHCFSLLQSFVYPYKRFVFSSNFGLNSYFYSLTSATSANRVQISHLVYGGDPVTYIRVFENKFSGNSFGFKSSLGISFLIFDSVSLFGNAGYTWANLKLKKGQEMNYFSEYTNSLGETTIESIQEPVDIEKADIQFGVINYNSWNFRFGLRYTFKE